MKYCPNCHFPLPKKAKFCTQCGQKNNDGRISLKALFKILWFRVLHLESRSLRFMVLLFVPGYVTQEFFRGRQKRYPQPVRFFFIVMFLFLFTVKHQSASKGLHLGTSYNGVKLEGIQPGQTPKSRNFYELGKRYTEFEKMRQEFDSLPAEYQQPVVRKAIDSLLSRTYGNDANAFKKFFELAGQIDSTRTYSADSLDFQLGGKVIKVATLDAFRFDVETLAAKYNISNWIDLLLIRQTLKAIQDPDALMNAYLGSLVWTILVIVALLAAVLTILYWRRGRYYVEHFMFLLNEHSAAFLWITLALWISVLKPLGIYWLLIGGWLVISPAFAMRRFYRQGWGKTLLKWLLFLSAYIVGFAFLFVIGMIIVFMIF